MRNFRPTRVRSIWVRQAPVAALVLWICLWLNLNTGYNEPPSSYRIADWLLFIRGLLPFVVLPVAGLLLLRRGKLHLPRRSPSRLLLIYGAFAAFATVFSPLPFWAMYWSFAFLATILAAWTFIDRSDPVDSSRQLLQITWVATFIVAAMIGYQARGVVFGEKAGLDVLTELNGLSRSSGVARWAAVPGLVCLVRAYHTRRSSLIAFFLGAAGVCFFIVYRMESRGAVFAAVAAMLFALLVSSRMRRYALPFAAAAIVLIFLFDSPTTVSNNVATYLRRGQDREEFLTMTGRTRAYQEALVAIEHAPFFGRGQWADRMIIRTHVHNSFLQALLNGGIFGGIPYFASWFAGWFLFYKLQKRRELLKPSDRIHLLECGTVMMFFTVRAMPETTTASYAVDLLVMVAVYVYLESLTLQMSAKRAPQLIRPYYVASPMVNRPRTQVRIGVTRQI